MSDNKTLIAGVCGIVIGVLFASAATDNKARFRALDKKLTAMDERISALGASTEAGAGSASAAAAEAVSAVGALGNKIDALAIGQERLVSDQGALAERLSSGLAGLDRSSDSDALAAVEAQIKALGETVQRMASDPQTRIAALPAEPAATDSDASPAQPGVAADGDAIALAFGSTAMVGDTRVFLSRRAGSDIVLALPGGRMVMAGPDAGEADLGNGCSVALLGVSGGQARLAADCTTTSAAAQTVLARSTAAPIVDMADDAATLQNRIGEDGLVLGFGESGMLGGERVLLSRMIGSDAVLHVAGGGDLRIGPDAGALDLGNGCVAVLAGMAERKAYIATLCDGDSLLAAADPAVS
ncbi:MAG: hypothetical protein AAFT19_06925, partial [Pseudomonadota bacterium]